MSVRTIIFMYNNIPTEVNQPSYTIDSFLCFSHLASAQFDDWIVCLIFFNSADQAELALCLVTLSVSFFIAPTLLECLGRLAGAFFFDQYFECFCVFCLNITCVYLLCTKLCDHTTLDGSFHWGLSLTAKASHDSHTTCNGSIANHLMGK